MDVGGDLGEEAVGEVEHLLGGPERPGQVLDPDRAPVQVGDGMRWFRHKARGGMALEDDIRQLVNRRRYVGAVT